MAKRNSSESTGGRRGSSSSRSGSGKSFSGKGRSTDKPYKKFDKGDSRGASSPKGERSSSSSREERPYKKFDKSSPSKPFGRKTDEGADQRNRPFSSAPRGSGGSSERPYKKFDKPFSKSTSRRDDSGDRRENKSFGSSRGDSTGRPYKKFDKPFDKSSRRDGDSSDRRESKSFGARGESSGRPYKKFDKPFDKSSRREGDSSDKREPRSFGSSSRESSDKPYKKFDRSVRGEGTPEKREPRSFSASRRDSDDKPGDRSEKTRGEESSDNKRKGFSASSEKPYKKVERPSRKEGDSEEPEAKPRGASFGLPFKRAYDKTSPRGDGSSAEQGEKPFIYPRKFKSKRPSETVVTNQDSDVIRLNRYIANSGLSSRREADEFIKMGLVSVNGTVITELGYKVKRSDEVRYEDKVLKAEKPVYILMNKPKGYITTTKDPQERNTVMHILEGKIKERVYPVGRLDRNTTGLLLLTNDGELADKLMHPSYKAKKIYKVDLDRPLTKGDFKKVLEGVYLEEGRAVVDDLAIIGDDGKSIGIEIHIGWNRVVRRIFEALGYEVVKLDRSVYAGLDKKELPRGHWRALTTEEIVMLKHYKK